MRADILVDGGTCRNLDQSAHLEWLDTNSLGAYAMGTVAGVRTRRYHGLLNSPAPNAPGNHVWLNCLEESIVYDNSRFLLSAQQYPGIVSPRGFELLSEFRLAPHPTWIFQLNEAVLQKEILLIDGLPAVLVRYCCTENVDLEVRPFLSGRHHHHMQRAAASQPWDVDSTWDLVALHRGPHSLFIRSDAREFVAQPDWYYRFEYAVERARGLDHHEDLFTPGTLHFSLRADTWAYFICGLEDVGPLDPLKILSWIEAKEHRFPKPHASADLLSNAAEHFIFRREHCQSVIAGYPWFTDWGRDTFISLPGLFLARNRMDDAAQVIDTFLSLRSDGLIPNRITDDGSTPEYNSIDATLWLFIAVHEWLQNGGDRTRFQDRFFAPMRDMLLHIARGTIHAIHADPADGLLNAGTSDTQLTWMDARINGVPVTPRFGKAVEINALWYNALRLMTEWSRERGEFTSELKFGELANQSISGFTKAFWNPAANCLHDVVRPGIADSSIRPNQIFAISLPFPMVIRSKGEAILQVVERDLLTPFGLRTLAPSDPKFQARFEGGPAQRDNAYHQGTVWPWLIGPYVRACLKIRADQPEERARCRALLDPLIEHLHSGCLGQLPENFDATTPQRQGGTPAQAWSVAEVLALLRLELAS
jgi:predicted glycogen debranching enzyme